MRQSLEHFLCLNYDLLFEIHHLIATQFFPRTASRLSRLVQEYLFVADGLQDACGLRHTVEALFGKDGGLGVLVAVREQAAELELELGENSYENDVFLT